ncbi:MAG: hypothetical protein ACLRR3_04305 [Eubacterium sp.]
MAIMDTYAERQYFFQNGKIIKDGNTKEILLDKELMERKRLGVTVRVLGRVKNQITFYIIKVNKLFTRNISTHC